MLLYGVQERRRTNCAREPPRRIPDFMASSPIRSLLSRHTLRPQSPLPPAFLHYCHVASFPRVSRTASTRLLGRTQGVGQVSSSDPRIRQIVHLSLGPRWARIVTTRWIYPALCKSTAHEYRNFPLLLRLTHEELPEVRHVFLDLVGVGKLHPALLKLALGIVSRSLQLLLTVPQRQDAGRQDPGGQLARLDGLLELLKPLPHVP